MSRTMLSHSRMVDPMTRRDLWAGVDVGGRRKGFHVAVISNTSLVDLNALPAPREVVAWLAEHGPHLTAVDSPLGPAIEGERSRAGERALVAAGVCSLRYTPDRQALAANPMYYEWIAHGFELYQALFGAGLSAIECFPTASWTRWAGPRGKASRAAWSRAAVTTLGLEDIPLRLNQDKRDAIAAAATARALGCGETETYGDIVVPLRTTEMATYERAR
jgi:predicted nuclease with RNAse H fold